MAKEFIGFCGYKTSKISRCGYAPMEFDKKKRLMVCSKCKKSSWEVKK